MKELQKLKKSVENIVSINQQIFFLYAVYIGSAAKGTTSKFCAVNKWGRCLDSALIK